VPLLAFLFIIEEEDVVVVVVVVVDDDDDDDDVVVLVFIDETLFNTVNDRLLEKEAEVEKDTS
jgi:hypothetical protein